MGWEDRVAQLVRWLKIDSTSGQEGAYLEVLERDLEAEGFQVERLEVPGEPFDKRWNLLATTGSDPEVVLSTHVDTVPPFLPVELRDGGAIYARGACDTKGVLMAMVEAAARLRAADPALAKRVGILLVIGEETDHCGAAAAASLPLRPKRIILGEPTRCQVALGQKGILKARVLATGKAGHSAFLDAGHSAIDKLLDVLWRVRQAQWPQDPDLGPTTINVGMIRGGVAANIFAPEASADLMFRAVSDTQGLEAQLRQLAGEQAQVQVLSRGEPQHFDRPPRDEETCVVPFNSDAAWLRPLGPVWLTGPGDIRLAHSDHEHITVADLEAGAQLYQRLIRAALEG